MMKRFALDLDYLEIAIENLTRKQSGVLFTALLRYAREEPLPEMDGVTEMAFLFIKPQIDKQRVRTNAGENHWNWKGGITPQSRADRTSAQYKEFRIAVLQRDNFTCQKCGQVGGALNVHHIKRFSEYPELRFEVSNGVTLCEQCHREVHRSEKR